MGPKAPLFLSALDRAQTQKVSYGPPIDWKGTEPCDFQEMAEASTTYKNDW